ncbi:hypothetical protein AUEXF2481DRAFT_44489 [Aureobasidium subglaciale EXF-2481]|uniref:histidine kinase n=1 Tax=Aureobasidium subglaciale (strain EXF-2481) TaxID=1043005 RepID=A0A074XZX6_AURSE|nr:uncharacterized protein AUEXF2481DRAFT_44489 [Aureobasidium subglaciale EXF-2481]KAI5197937.1 hypothetical protein E4T38_07749 [Aureobasidium subglaciale]KAI5216817.1 hypothetical protein E4T40_07759 [Aureobasidium subglaciale]KAI5220033.1 hypothetical protein E4T41_07674 [Aureobasidium subglaciale]KAI5257873.1 hypothetical protein E4T46_07650 [Aureobasidium subglaciale]KEQ91093.1 hypothetical protein AUEXF2481DRAFT_44489 [Aureobasidium subglaciale EXF-2481]
MSPIYATGACGIDLPLLRLASQNGCLRLRCERAFLCLVQDATSHIITRSRPWTSACEDEADDDFLASEASHGLLEQSAAVFRGGKAQGDALMAHSSCHVIGDLHGNAKHALDFPQLRSFAAVPVRSASGHLLAIYGVFDNKPRHDFSDADTLSVLFDIASAMADHVDFQFTRFPCPRSSSQSTYASRCPALSDHEPGYDSSSTSSRSSDSASLPHSPFDHVSSNPSLPTSTSDSMAHDNAADYFSHHKTSPPDATPRPDPLSLDIASTRAIELRLVSSISHELRSPLHGALAAIEFLQDTPLDDNQSDLAYMVQACATTLLDTLNHLLDYSTVRATARRKSFDQSAYVDADLFGSITEQYLCRLVQDTVEGVYFGHISQQVAYSKNRHAPGHAFTGVDNPSDPILLMDDYLGVETSAVSGLVDSVAVYLDMDNCGEWYTRLCTGAWTRLVMNLFGNALKYTRKGHVEVTLRMLKSDDDDEINDAHLMVKDTGIGMSDSFLNNRIYRPFVQEDSLAPGAGLGLSIVKSIVDELGGTISVQSDLGVGTRFDVHIPLSKPNSLDNKKNLSGGEILDSEALLKGRTLCLLSPCVAGSDTRVRPPSLMHTYVRSIAEKWFDMKTIEASMTSEVDADIFIAEALHVVEEAAMNPTFMASIDKPQIILVGPLPTAGAQKHANNQILGYPIDPKNVCRALLAAINHPCEVDYPSPPLLTPETTIKLTRGVPFGSEHSARDQLPRQAPAQQDHALAQADDGAEHLLLVDDNAINLKLISALAKKLGVSADTAVDGKDALEAYVAALKTNKPFTTVFMDVSMPIMDGFESTRAIRSHEAETNVAKPARIIALTGLGSAAHRQEAVSSGMDEFRTKPVAMKTLKGLLGV